MEIVNIDRLDTTYPSLKKFALAVASEANGANWDYIKITDTYRSPDMQAALYAQGREDLETVNALRAKVGYYPILASQNVIVTNARAGRSAHSVVGSGWKGAAMDWYAIKGGKFYTGSDWYDLQKKVIAGFPDLKMGLTFGDPPHIEFKDYRSYIGLLGDAAMPDAYEGGLGEKIEYSYIRLGTAIFFLVSILVILYLKYIA